MKATAWMALVLVLCGSTVAHAHEGGVDARGVLISADAGQVSVRGADGKELRFVLTPRTRIVVGGRAAKPADLVPGQRAVIHARKAGDQLEAASVRVSAASQPAR